MWLPKAAAHVSDGFPWDDQQDPVPWCVCHEQWQNVAEMQMVTLSTYW